jgi:fatty acid desaturase
MIGSVDPGVRRRGVDDGAGNIDAGDEVLPGRVPRHRFSESVTEDLRGLRKLDNWHGPLALLTDWVVILAVAVLTESVSGWAWWPVYLLVALPVIGTRQRALATLLHESAHETLARDKRLNKFLGTWFSGYVIFQAFEAYRRSHVRGHHGSFGDPRRDPDLRAHISAGMYRPQSGLVFTWRYLVSPLLGRRTPAILKELVLARLSGTRQEIVRGVAVVLYVAAIGGALAWFGLLTQFLAYWLVPLLVVFPLVNWYIEMLEHFPLAGNENLDVRTTRHRALGWVSRHFLGMHNEGYHLDHHLSPKVPFWNLPAAHRARLRDSEYAQAIAETAPEGKPVLWQFKDMVARVEEGRVDARLGRFVDLETVDRELNGG